MNTAAFQYLTSQNCSANDLALITKTLWNDSGCQEPDADYYVSAFKPVDDIERQGNNNVWNINTKSSLAFAHGGTDKWYKKHCQSLKVDFSNTGKRIVRVIHSTKFIPVVDIGVGAVVRRAGAGAGVGGGVGVGAGATGTAIQLDVAIVQNAITSTQKDVNGMYTFVRQSTVDKKQILNTYVNLCTKIDKQNNTYNVTAKDIHAPDQNQFWVDLQQRNQLKGFIKFSQITDRKLFPHVFDDTTSNAYQQKNTLKYTIFEKNKEGTEIVATDNTFQQMLQQTRGPMPLLFIDNICAQDKLGYLLYKFLLKVANLCKCKYVLLNAIEPKPYLPHFKFIRGKYTKGQYITPYIYMIASVADIDSYVKERENDVATKNSARLSSVTGGARTPWMSIGLGKSTRPDKLYMAVVGRRKVHFGRKGVVYFVTKNPRDKAALKHDFLREHSGEDWSIDGVLTPQFWTRWVLWNKPSKAESIKNMQRRFNVSIHAM
jgi:hypothetical protein